MLSTQFHSHFGISVSQSHLPPTNTKPTKVSVQFIKEIKNPSNFYALIHFHIVAILILHSVNPPISEKLPLRAMDSDCSSPIKRYPERNSFETLVLQRPSCLHPLMQTTKLMGNEVKNLLSEMGLKFAIEMGLKLTKSTTGDDLSPCSSPIPTGKRSKAAEAASSSTTTGMPLEPIEVVVKESGGCESQEQEVRSSDPSKKDSDACEEVPGVDVRLFKSKTATAPDLSLD